MERNNIKKGDWGLTVLNPEVDVDLVEDVAHAEGAGLGEHGEAEVGRGLVVVELVVLGAERDEGVVLAAQLADHVAQAEDRAEDQLCVVRGRGPFSAPTRPRGPAGVAAAGGRRGRLGDCDRVRGGGGGGAVVWVLVLLLDLLLLLEGRGWLLRRRARGGWARDGATGDGPGNP